MVHKLATKIGNYYMLTVKSYEICSMYNAQEAFFTLQTSEIMLWILRHHHIRKVKLLSMPSSFKQNLLFSMNKPHHHPMLFNTIANQILTELPISF